MKDRLLRPLHVAVRGRARLAVPGLYGDPRLARLLEHGFAGDPDVRSVSASPVTGKALVLFSPATAHETLLVRLEAIFVRAVGQSAQAGGAADQAAEDWAATAPGQPGRRAGGLPRANGHAEAWHALEAGEVLGFFASDARDGLTQAAADRALRRHGANELARTPPRRPLAILLDQLTTLPVGLLVGSAAFSILTGGLLDAAAIVSVVAINAAIGFATESQAERTISSLDRDAQPEAQLVRDGTIQHRPLAEVVPGDILALAPGMLLPADARILEARDLSVDESLLTGESLPVRKAHEAALPCDAPLAQRCTMLYRGTAITGGEGRAVVVATGSRTEIGKIQALVGATRPPPTPLQRQLDQAGERLGYLSLALCGGMLGLGLLRGYGMTQMLKASISLAIAALPEGLPTVATVTLALGIRDMRRHKVVIRRLNAVETLGSVHMLCFDKTGTLTLNHMQALQVFAGERSRVLPGGRAAGEQGGAGLDDPAFRQMLEACVLCSDVELEAQAEGGYELRGSATEMALMQLAIDHGIEPEALRASHPLIDVAYRSELRKHMATRHRLAEGHELLAVKGSPEEVLALSSRVLIGGETLPLDEARRAAIAAENERMGKAGLRVLGFAVARREAEREPEPLTWLGLIGLADPVRPEMAGLMRTFRKAGLRTVMITGDQVATAYTVARALDLSGTEGIEILEGIALDKVDPQVLSALALKTDVFARVTPANKLQIVRALQAANEIVAMTGDGVNDSPALRAADIGVAMGSGSDAAHEVADVILQDDELATMVVAIAKGRSIYANIRKAVMFLLSTNLSEIMVMMGGTAFGLGQPLTPAQLLWINIVTDVFPGLALGLDPPEKGVLELPPRDPNKAVIDKSDFARISGEGGLITLAALASHLIGRPRNAGAGQVGGFGFTTLTVAQLLHALSCRSQTRPAFAVADGAPNPHLRRALIGLLGLQLFATFLPLTRRMLGLSGMRPADILAAAGLGTTPFMAIEGAKAARRTLGAVVREEKGTEP